MKKRIMYGVLLAVLFIYLICVCTSAPAEEDYFRIVLEMGYQDVEKTPCEVVNFTIPEEFNAVYERYNALQKEGGFDLGEYKGKKCKRYTYLIPSQNARANIIVHKGQIIGGDISGITIDGIMKPIIRRHNDAT